MNNPTPNIDDLLAKLRGPHAKNSAAEEKNSAAVVPSPMLRVRQDGVTRARLLKILRYRGMRTMSEWLRQAVTDEFRRLGLRDD